LFSVFLSYFLLQELLLQLSAFREKEDLAMGDADMPQVVTVEDFHALQRELREMKGMLLQHEKGEWVSENALHEVPTDPTKSQLSSAERKKLLKAYPEDTRFTWQGASLGKEERARMSKEARSEESALFDIESEVMEALRPLLNVLDINFNDARREKLLKEERIMEEIGAAVAASYKLLAGSLTDIEMKRKEIALIAISPKLASLAKPAPANPLITKEDRERMEGVYQEQLLEKRLAGDGAPRQLQQSHQQPFRAGGHRGGNVGRGNFPQSWSPYRGSQTGNYNRGGGRGRGAPHHVQQPAQAPHPQSN